MISFLTYYLINLWRIFYTVIIDDVKIFIEKGLETVLSIGDKCNVEYILGKEYWILPERIKLSF